MIAYGRLSAVAGPAVLPVDHTLRIVDFPRAVPAIVSSMPEETRAWLAGFVAGINAVIDADEELPNEFRLFGVQPRYWTIEDVVATSHLAQIADWDVKLVELLPLSRAEDIGTIGGTASWLLLFLQSAAAQTGGGLRDAYPNLELIVYGGVNFAPYRNAFETLLGDTAVDLRDVYPASEGFLAVTDRGVGEGLRLQIDGDIFFELVLANALDYENSPRHWMGNVQAGVNYALVLNMPVGA